MRIIRRNYFRNIVLFVILSLFLYAAHLHFDLDKNSYSKNDIKRNINSINSDLARNELNEYFPESGAFSGLEKVSWENETAKKLDSHRTGLGEQGRPASLDNEDKKLREELWDTNGFHALLSDSIALDRSLQDIRHAKCSSFKYSKVLPTVSVVIPFFEEHWTTLLRTVVSVINRSPPSVLKEIILVNDGSTKEFLGEKLDSWLLKNQPKARVLRLPERVGLIQARQEGAKVATADVIIVLDSHCEVMTGWLPPLLEPIIENPRTAVCPLIDVINSETFVYYPQDEGARGSFDWRFFYKRLPLFSEDVAKLPEPFANPVMNGGLFAISRKFFWDLGGYDTGIKIWGGEQYNLSFKIWQCGGRLLDAPCSRVGHVFRNGGKKRPAAKNAGDFISVNYKRVAVVWMDEYAEALYRRNPKLRTIDAGDISAEKEVRDKLQCKPFSWFLSNVAPDLVKVYPPIEPDDFANGTISSVENPSLCIDTGSQESGDLILYGCHGIGPQFFRLGWQKTLKVESEQFCWSSPSEAGKAPSLTHCSKDPPPSHIWRYDPRSHVIHEKAYGRCLQAHTKEKTVSLEFCDPSLISQRWTFQFVNNRLITEKFRSI